MGCDLYVRGNQLQAEPWGDRSLPPVCRDTHHADGVEQQAEHSLGCSEQQAGGFGSPAAVSLASARGATLGGGNTQLCFPFSVLDVNDESPTFFPAIYNVSLPENVARDFKVVRLNCTDADVGLNAELSYFITGMNPFQNPARGVGGELWLWKGAGCPRLRPGCSAHLCCLFQPLQNLGQYRPLPHSPARLPTLLTAPSPIFVLLGMNPCPVWGEPLSCSR